VKPFLFVLAAVLAACRGKASTPPAARDAAPPATDAAPAVWPELAALPRTAPDLVVEVPGSRRGIAPSSLVGPVVAGDLAIVGAAPRGFTAIAWRTGAIAWTSPAGARLAPPVPHPTGVVLVADCVDAPLVPADQRVAGCWHVVSFGGRDFGHGVITGPAALIEPFLAATGPDQLVPLADNRVRWTRGAHALDVDLSAGTATAAASTAPAPVIARHRGREWRIAIEPDGALVARDPAGAESWRMRTRFAAVLGVRPGQAHEVPMVRVVNLAGPSGHGIIDLLDIDATGSKSGQAGSTVPGVALLAHAFAGAPGDTAMAIRIDAAAPPRDYVAAHDGSGTLMWVWPAPAPPSGLAFTDDGSIVAFVDGRKLAIFAASNNPTP
jgi:hypothetical protein